MDLIEPLTRSVVRETELIKAAREPQGMYLRSDRDFGVAEPAEP